MTSIKKLLKGTSLKESIMKNMYIQKERWMIRMKFKVSRTSILDDRKPCEEARTFFQLELETEQLTKRNVRQEVRLWIQSNLESCF